jgi:hypothetical protein
MDLGILCCLVSSADHLDGRIKKWIEAISKKGFWFKIAADARFKPEVRLRRIGI